MAAEVDRLTRFQREAEILAALNHPNIAQIYGLERSGATVALVMELVDGPTLADRIGRGPIPIPDAMAIARQIAEALDAAHEQGIVHHLKPANVKVRDDGTVKVLDFGLAKAMDPAGASNANAENSPTISLHATQAGVILGTAAYMSPEQAAGRLVDRRTDMWAFGAVMFEMVTGRRPFGGDTVSDVIAAVLKDEPDWTRLPPDTPATLHKQVRRCLEKDRKRRLDSAADARLESEDMATHRSADVAQAPASGRRWSSPAAWWAASVACLALVGAAALLSRSEVSTRQLIRLPMLMPAGEIVESLAMSPDGLRIAVTSYGAVSRILIRSLDSMDVHVLTGTEGGVNPSWSPDGRSVGFFGLDGRLQRIDVAGGFSRRRHRCPDSGQCDRGGRHLERRRRHSVRFRRTHPQGPRDGRRVRSFGSRGWGTRRRNPCLAGPLGHGARARARSAVWTHLPPKIAKQEVVLRDEERGSDRREESPRRNPRPGAAGACSDPTPEPRHCGPDVGRRLRPAARQQCSRISRGP